MTTLLHQNLNPVLRVIGVQSPPRVRPPLHGART
jgi:hypothetical protein